MSSTNSIWLVLGPAGIAGSVGVFTTFLANRSARKSQEQASLDLRDSWSHERSMRHHDRELDAIEQVWTRIFELETRDLGPDSRRDLIRSVVWLPDELRQEILGLLVTFQTTEHGPDREQALHKVRVKLLETATPADHKED